MTIILKNCHAGWKFFNMCLFPYTGCNYAPRHGSKLTANIIIVSCKVLHDSCYLSRDLDLVSEA